MSVKANMQLLSLSLLFGFILFLGVWTASFFVENEKTVHSEKIEIPIKSNVVSLSIPNVDLDQVHCLATNVWHEARGTSKADKLAVAHVTKNRVMSSRFPNSVCSVIFQGRHILNRNTGKLYPIIHQCQFSWYCDGRSDHIRITDENGTLIHKNVVLWNEIWRLAYETLAGLNKDPTSGATHYLNPRVLNSLPNWTKIYDLVHKTDGHDFYRMNYGKKEEAAPSTKKGIQLPDGTKERNRGKGY